MPQFFKKLLLLKIFSKKQIVLVFLFFLILFLFYPISSAQAVAWYLAWPLKIAVAIITLHLQLVVLIAQAVLVLGILLLKGVISFINTVHYTNPAQNELIRIGWTLIRDIVNIGFILGLIYIGLATALQLAGFNLKKALPLLLLMALLVNFTPLICGIVVDAANLITNYFLAGLVQWDTLSDTFGIQWATIKDAVKGAFEGGDPDFEPVLTSLILIGFGILGGFILGLFAFLFLVRIFAIWILVILSPFAFVSYIFTKKWWSTWWHQLIQWSFIGAIGGFFLYLSHHALYLAKEAKLGLAPLGEDPSGGVLSEIAPFFATLIFMAFGLLVVLQTSAMGASAVIGAVKGGAGAAAKIGTAVGWKGAKAGAKLGWKGVKGGVKRTAKGAAVAAKGVGTAIAHPARTGKAFVSGIKRGAAVGGAYVRRVPGAIKSAPGAALRGIKAAPGAIRRKAEEAWILRREYAEEYRKRVKRATEKLKPAVKSVKEAFGQALWQYKIKDICVCRNPDCTYQGPPPCGACPRCGNPTIRVTRKAPGVLKASWAGAKAGFKKDIGRFKI
ncbi:MAG: hypothetical protein QMC93_02090 [Patescibacteria group bacterium]|nr:hypothetical protein [Patescibacteria group bacterium]